MEVLVAKANEFEPVVLEAERQRGVAGVPTAGVGEVVQGDGEGTARDGECTVVALGIEVVVEIGRLIARDEGAVLQSERVRVAGSVVQGNGKDARVGVERINAEAAFVLDDVAPVGVVEDEGEVRQAIAVQVAGGLDLNRPSRGREVRGGLAGVGQSGNLDIWDYKFVLRRCERGTTNEKPWRSRRRCMRGPSAWLPWMERARGAWPAQNRRLRRIRGGGASLRDVVKR